MNIVVQADKAAFGQGRAQHANALIEEAGLRIDQERRRGRGAGMNPSGRFEAESRHVYDDGWETIEDLPPFKTEVQIEKPRTIITRNNSPDIGFDRSINPYRGCEHGCIYCFARPTHSYMGFQQDWISNRSFSPSQTLPRCWTRNCRDRAIRQKPLRLAPIPIPISQSKRNGASCVIFLQVLEAHQHPVGIVTKSALVMRDQDILGRMAEKGLAKVALSVTTLDGKLARTMEPRASTPTRRLQALRSLSDAGIPVSVMVAPVIPGLNDHEIERVLDSARAMGALEAGYVLLRLPLEVSPIFKEWLLRNYPDRYRHVLSLVRSMRGGKDYDAEWGKRMRGEGPYAWQIGRRFEIAAKRLGLNLSKRRLRTDLFSPAPGNEQLSLF